MISISLCLIVKNEEHTLDNCLSSVKGIPDEIIIVDTGSTDRTKEIARKWTSHVYDFEWIDD
ncbi:glycosyltransferase, partial [Bacillus thuringiensis]